MGQTWQVVYLVVELLHGLRGEATGVVVEWPFFSAGDQVFRERCLDKFCSSCSDEQSTAGSKSIRMTAKL